MKPKQIKFSYKISEHDLEVKAKNVQRLIDKGHSVRVSLLFKGRELTHPEEGMKKLRSLWEKLENAHMSTKPLLKEHELFMVVLKKKEK